MVMMRELTEKDFASGVKNPHFDKLMAKIEVAIRKDDWNTFLELSKLKMWLLHMSPFGQQEQAKLLPKNKRKKPAL